MYVVSIDFRQYKVEVEDADDFILGQSYRVCICDASDNVPRSGIKPRTSW